MLLKINNYFEVLEARYFKMQVVLLDLHRFLAPLEFGVGCGGGGWKDKGGIREYRKPLTYQHSSQPFLMAD